MLKAAFLSLFLVASPLAGVFGDPCFCGDTNCDTQHNVADVVHLLSHVFGGQAIAGDGDVNGDGNVDVSDAIWLTSWLFYGGPEPRC